MAANFVQQEVVCTEQGGFCCNVLWEDGSTLCLLVQEQWARCSCPRDALGNSCRSVQDGCPVVQSAVGFKRSVALKAEKGERGKGQEENRGHLREREHVLAHQGIEGLLLGVPVITKVVRCAKEVTKKLTVFAIQVYPFLEMEGGFGNGADGDEVLEQSKHLSLGQMTAGKELLRNMLCKQTNEPLCQLVY